MARDRGVQRVVDQRRLARPRHAGHARQQPDRNFERHVLQIVAVRAADFQPRRKRWRAVVRYLDLAPAGQILAGQRVRIVKHFFERALRDDFATVHARAESHVDHVVGGANRIFVVLDDDHRVAEVAQVLQRVDQAAVVALVQADRWLIEHVHHAGEARSRSATPAGCVATRRPTASRPSDRATNSRARR